MVSSKFKIQLKRTSLLLTHLCAPDSAIQPLSFHNQLDSAYEPAFFIPENETVYNLLNQNNYLDSWTYLAGKYFAKNKRTMFIFVL
jgi:hypothetical protein